MQNLNLIQNKVNKIIDKRQLKSKPTIIVISKTFSHNKIKPLIDGGHLHFGENKIQEAEAKWNDIKNNYKNIKLHMVGKLQSNKAKKALNIFDYIHSLDNPKLASKLSQHEKELNKKIKYFIQINLGEEKQKSGIILNDLNNFYDYCTNKLLLNIIGLMCIPPVDLNSQDFFKILKKTADKLNLKELSMGMSMDYEDAVLNGATYLRLGTAILGERVIK